MTCLKCHKDISATIKIGKTWRQQCLSNGCLSGIFVVYVEHI